MPAPSDCDIRDIRDIRDRPAPAHYITSPAVEYFGPSVPEIYTHTHIHAKLNDMLRDNSVPNLLFHGPVGSGKRTVVDWFVRRMYVEDHVISKMAFYLNCNDNNGIQYIRDEVSFIAKSNLHPESPISFKTIIFLNADKLTTDAQSALRRCIEVHNRYTRFVFVTSIRTALSKPILSRLGGILVLPKNSRGRFVSVNLNSIRWGGGLSGAPDRVLRELLDTTFFRARANNPMFLMNSAKEIVSRGYAAIDVIEYVKSRGGVGDDELRHCRNQSEYNMLRLDIKNEEAMIFIVLLNTSVRQDTLFEKIYTV
jgi:hypothetical protein